MTNPSGIPPNSPLTVEDFFTDLKVDKLATLAKKSEWHWRSYSFFMSVRRRKIRDLSEKQVTWLFKLKDAVLNYDYHGR